MIESVTLEQVETLVVRLPPKDQLKLLAHISKRLSDTLSPEPAAESDHEQRVREERLRLAKALCDEVGDIIDDAKGSFDAAEDIRRMREVDLSTLLAFDRGLHRLLELKRESQLQTAQDMTAREEFRQQYPHLRVDPDLFALVGIHPTTSVEEDKALIRAQILRRLSE